MANLVWITIITSIINNYETMHVCSFKSLQNMLDKIGTEYQHKLNLILANSFLGSKIIIKKTLIDWSLSVKQYDIVHDIEHERMNGIIDELSMNAFTICSLPTHIQNLLARYELTAKAV